MKTELEISCPLSLEGLLTIWGLLEDGNWFRIRTLSADFAKKVSLQMTDSYYPGFYCCFQPTVDPNEGLPSEVVV
ncbi:hypothetical protein [Paenibacillus sp. GP183]|jgi:hypothetical protein|uniref:hypothetical protein n=1 Tax=Paenibacillus sp. GP183 TaxID=1882751 RepID=UPI0008999DEA|nr:hypothetical protein [Paenibacillus sp. GP183]SED10614.1 hypothetical protein SAMN05443246_5731 [Paenibacillus sp. GP183]